MKKNILATLKKYLATLKRIATPSLRTAGLRNKDSFSKSNSYFCRENIVTLQIFKIWNKEKINGRLLECLGHDQLLEICLLKKSARHDFIIARQHSSNNYFSCQLVDSHPQPVKL